jgi:hypothetical protein
MTRPGAAAPVPHTSEILLARLPTGALPRQPVAFEESPHRGRSVADSPLGLGDLEDSRDGPQVCGEAEGEGSPSEELREGGQLLSRNEGGATRSRDGAEGLRPSVLDPALPVADGGRSDSEQSGDLRLGASFGEETESLESSFLERGGVAML